MNSHTKLLCALFLLMTSLLIACNSGSASSDAELTRIDIRNSRGETERIDVEVADTDAEREHGLSKRESLDRDTGMLFVFRQRGPGFWMKDTLIPLSVAFIGPCGEIVDIQDMEPESLQIHQASREYSFGLEVNQGWFATRDIAVGSTVTLPADLRPSTCG